MSGDQGKKKREACGAGMGLEDRDPKLATRGGEAMLRHVLLEVRTRWKNLGDSDPGRWMVNNPFNFLGSFVS